MAFTYNDTRNFNSHTHIDYSIIPREGLSGMVAPSEGGTVTWIDFIDFRTVNNFGFGSSKGPIGTNWLKVLEKLQFCFDEIGNTLQSLDNRISELERHINNITILGGNEIYNTSLTLSASPSNIDWNIRNMSTSDGSSNATQPNFAISERTSSSVKISVIGEPSWNNCKGTISWNNYSNSQDVIIGSDDTTIVASYNYPDTSQIRWSAEVVATSQSDNTKSKIHEVYKIFNNPNTNQGSWDWNITNSSNFTLSKNGDRITIRPKNSNKDCTGTLTCTNSNAEYNISLNIIYYNQVAEITITYYNYDNSVYQIEHLNTGDQLTLITGPTEEGYSFAGWYTNSDRSGNRYNAGFTWGSVYRSLEFWAGNTQYKYVISFNANGGNTTPSSRTNLVGSPITLPGSINRNADSTYTYTFKEWNTQSDGNGTSYSANQAVTFTKNITLYAIWIATPIQITQYTVTLDLRNGFANKNLSQQVNNGSSAQWTITPKSGYNLPTSITNGSISGNIITSNIVSNSNITVTAICTPIPITQYTVTLNLENGSANESLSQRVNNGSRAQWTITPNSGYNLPTSITNGSISGNIITSDPVSNSNITVNAICTEIQEEPTYKYYLGLATENQIQDQSYINSLDYNTSGIKPTELILPSGYNLIIYPENWGIPTITDDLGYEMPPYNNEDLGIINPANKIVIAEEIQANNTHVNLSWS